MVAGRTPGVHSPGFEEGADLAQRGRMIDIVPAVDPCVARGGGVQAEYEAHRRRLARTVGAKEAGDDPRSDGETEVGDGDPFAVELGETSYLDHPVTCKNVMPASVEIGTPEFIGPQDGLAPPRPSDLGRMASTQRMR
jgi:hypothetical protein